MNTSFKPKGCNKCQSKWHTSLHCPTEPRSVLRTASKPIKRESTKTRQKRQQTAREWHKLNKPGSDGMYTCYLQIHPDCPKMLTKDMLTLEHYHSKARRPDLKFDVTNLKPSCSPCNGMKLSKSGSDFNK